MICILTTSITSQGLAASNDIGAYILKDLYANQMEEKVKEATETEESKEYLKIQNELNEFYYEILDDVTIENDMEEDVIYDDYYGGAYIDGEELVINVTDEFDEAACNINLMNSNNQQVVIETVRYSLNELIDSQQYIVEKVAELKSKFNDEKSNEYKLLHSISSIATDEMNNGLFVDIVDLTDEKINMF